MRLTLQRTDHRQDGVFGFIPELGLYTLERPYVDLKPKVKAGKYRCVRGIHLLPSRKKVETFQVKGVKGHWGILFHPGNYMRDSAGCILIGESIVKGTPWMITASKRAFGKMMEALKGLDEFELTVVDAENSLPLA